MEEITKETGLKPEIYSEQRNDDIFTLQPTFAAPYLDILTQSQYKVADLRSRSPTEKSSPSSTASSEKQPVRKGWFIIIGFFAWSLSTYVFYNYVGYKRRRSSSPERAVPLDVSDRFDALAPEYDREVLLSEWLMRLGKRRKRLVEKASGHVLEASCGTGRNIEYFCLEDRASAILKGQWSRKSEIQSLTFVDKSPQMLNITSQKFAETWPEYQSARFAVADASSFSSLPPPPTGGYDTILQTMGLCSTPDPVALLKCLAASCRKPTLRDEGGKILLLEHGRGYYDWLNRYLDDSAPRHADRFGCWWNRDLEKILKESELEVVRVKRYHFGTTWEVELRPVMRIEELQKAPK